MGKGTLFVVATPLGHLDDLTVRAQATLRQVPFVAAEDTRETRKVLDHVRSEAKLISYHAHSSEHRAEAVLSLLDRGLDVALVTDAGTPAISDPGAELVASAALAGITVVPIPGPSAVATALSAGGLPADRYTFLGFIPRKGADRSQFLDAIVRSPWTVVLFEAPNRVPKLLDDLVAAGAGNRSIVLARELTKIHEEFTRGTVAALAERSDQLDQRGECTVVIEGRAEPEPDYEIARRVAGLLRDHGVDRRVLLEVLTDGLDVPRNVGYRMTLDGPA